MSRDHRSLGIAGLSALVLSAWLAGPATAGNLDTALLRKAPEMLEKLHKAGYRNVGVLPFQVKRGARPAGFDGGPLAVNLPGRLENALILSMSPDSKSVLGVIRDAAGAASAARVGPWTRSDEAFKALFATRYPLAWGDRKVSADAFLTGVVSNTGDRQKTTVQVQLIDRDSRAKGTVEPVELTRFDVVTDRALLRDLGYGYVLPRSALERNVTSRDRDRQAVRLVEVTDEEGEDQAPAASGRLPTPDDLAGMAFEIRYDNVKQPIRPLGTRTDGARSTQWQVDPVKAGTKVTLVLTRKLAGDKKLGVVVKVNGRSTWRFEDVESLKCKKWIFGPKMKDEPSTLEGFYMGKEGDFKRFQVLTAAESAVRADEFGEKAGWIDVDVFESSDGTTRQEPDGDQVQVTTRGLARPRGAPPQTQAELRKLLAKANNVHIPKLKGKDVGGLIVETVTAEKGTPIGTASLPNPVWVGGVSIKYWSRPAGGG